MTSDKPWTAADTALLQRLVAKYGRAATQAAVARVRPPPRPGRRYDDEKRQETWQHVEWIEARAEELAERHGERRGAMAMAVAERFKAVTPPDQQTEAELRRFEARIKRVRDEWARVEKIHREGRVRPIRRVDSKA